MLALLVPMLLKTSGAMADIYRWQDEQGKWHFSDSPPSNVDTDRFITSGDTQAAGTGAYEAARPAASPPPQAQPRAGGGQAGVFWRVTKDGRPASYLLGTIHSTDPRVTRLRPEVQAALDHADRFVMEMVMDTGALLQFGTNIMLEDGADLEDLLGRSLFSRVASAMSDYGMPEMVVHQLKPWVAMAMLSMPRPSGEAILDMVLYQRAQGLGIPVSGLESAREQLAVFEGMPLADQIEMLKMTLDQLPHMPAMFEQLLQAYLADDLSRIAGMADQYKSRQNTQSMQRFMFKLNDERSRRMLRRTIPYLEQGNSFVAVGALHLAGPAGLVTTLRSRGYDLEPVR
jgi:uncharacterized protein YbaP (TraB family)